MKVINTKQLSIAVKYLKQGKILVFPTETSYGLGCDATNQLAVDKIFKIKERKSDKPLLVVAPTVDMAKKYLVWNELLEGLANKYWPGALTIVGEYNKKEKLATGVVSKENTIAVRVTAYPLLRSIIEKLGRAVVATSANISDAGDIYEAKKVIIGFGEAAPDIIIDSGELPRRLPSTVVSAVGGQLKILRQGELVINI